ncbi:hypothetical protein BaRGS_00026977 [Batillaria attramentaria]|uniref:Reverse transcriptase domain-containing protein n=1 Tax=Batillaria attramentaria TaxID=370345 RepID=A0ABD0K4H6_9CAEN
MIKPNISLADWKKHFESLLNQSTTAKYDKVHEPTDYCEITDTPITEKEIQEAIRHLKRNKASGWDGIPAEVLKNARYIIPFLKAFFNALLDAGYFPKPWCMSIIVPLYKKGNADEPGNYRGVSLLSVVSKVFTYILNKRLTEWAEEQSVIAKEQAGVRSDHSTVDHIFTFIAIIQKSMSQGKRKAYVAFIDYEKAFDSVDRTCLWSLLCKRGLSR